jgi:[acyl-carrier-protein] S-malonyltransferase
MSKTTLFFPGQASQYVGMGKDLYEHSAAVRRLYELASTDLKVDLAKLSFEGPAEKLKQTRFTQPAILVHSLAVMTVLGEEFPAFDYAAGHSLGEYGALAAAGALSFDDAIAAVVRRATLMEEACVAQPGTMAAMMGLSEAQIIEVCAKASSAGVVVPANFNSNSQIAVSGSIAGVEEAVRVAKEMGAKRAIMLEVGGAFHSPLMAPAQAGMKEFLSQVTINSPRVPVVANVTARPVSEPAQIRDLLVSQITSPVKWSHTMAYLVSQGVTRLIEVGPGKVLTGLARREMNPEVMINLDTLADIQAFTAPVV